MARQTKIFCWIGVVALGAMVVGVFFWKEIRIAYHRNRMFAAMENYVLITGQTRMPTRFEGLKFAVFKMSSTEESEAITQHESVLLNLGHLEKRDFWFTNRTIRGDSNSWMAIRQQITNTFNASHWWSGSFLESNGFRVTATPADLSKWEKLLSDFDRSGH